MGTGPALSSGDWAVKELWFPAVSRIPIALDTSATVKAPTEVSAAPAPSVSESVAIVPLTATDEIDPPLGRSRASTDRSRPV